MKKLLAALAGHPRVGIDMNIAAGEAITLWSRIRAWVLGIALVSCAFLAVGYVSLWNQNVQMDKDMARYQTETQAYRLKAQAAWTEIIALLERANGGPTR